MDILKLKESNCKDCYKCIRHCPVKAIKMTEKSAVIMKDECILCGKCTFVCPQNAKEIRYDTNVVKDYIAQGKKVVATVDPSFITSYKVDNFGVFKATLLEMGFYDAFEAAEGYALVRHDYERIIRERKQSVVISTYCPSIVSLAEKYFPSVVKYLAPTLSPVETSARIIKQRIPDAIVVFIGPCIANKLICEEEGANLDVAITYEELNSLLRENKIYFDNKKVAPYDKELRISRLSTITDGITTAMERDSSYYYISADSAENCIDIFKEIEKGNIENCFLELSSCHGSCVGGPMSLHRKDTVSSFIKIAQNALDKTKPVQNDYDIKEKVDMRREFKHVPLKKEEFSSEKIRSVLVKMGKKTPKDELNCGACGYFTCREKAKAVLAGKAILSMCIPYMKNRAESFNDKIISATPNGIIVVNAKHEIIQINKSAMNFFDIKSEAEILHKNIGMIMDEYDFANVFASKRKQTRIKKYFPELSKCFEKILVYDSDNHLIICILRDVTAKEMRNKSISKARNSAIEITDKIVEKQMGIVHEIAMLLGETTAETKVALEKLKRTIIDEEEEL